MPSLLQKAYQLLSSLGINFIPAGGLFFGGWSPATVLGVYWFENVAGSLLVACRILVQSWIAPRQGHFHYEQRSGTSKGDGPLILFFLPPSLAFSLGHGVFLAGIFLVVTHHGHPMVVDWPQMIQGCEMVLALLLLNFVVDLWGLRYRPFAWIERLTSLNLSRVLLVHVAIVFGLLATAFTGAGTTFFGVFVALKTLCDLTALLPPWNPTSAPMWLCRIMDAMASKPGGITFAETFATNLAQDLARRVRNEQPMPAKPL